MDDSMINPLLLSSSVYLENVERLIKNLEKQTLNVENFEDILNNDNRQEIINKSFSSSIIPINDRSITFLNDDENLSTNNFLTQRDNQYDIHANYRLTFGTDESQQINRKSRRRKMSSTYSDDDILSNVANHMNNRLRRSSFKQIRSQSNPPSSQQQQISNQNNSSRSSTSWRQMKESQRTTTTTTEIETKESRSPSPLNLYKIFQQKSHLTTASSFRNPSKLTRQHHDVTDQAIQTSILLDNQDQTISPTVPKSKSYNHFATSTPISSSYLHKSLPDLSFISHYSKELPRSLTTSPLTLTCSSTNNITRTTPSPTLIQQQKQDSDRPRTLKSIKRYKNSKHSTEPLGVFYSPQLRKTFTTIQSTIRQEPLNPSREHHSENDLTQENTQTKPSVNNSENISKHLKSPCNPSNTSSNHHSLLTKRYGEMRRCQTDIIVVDPILHFHSLTDSPPNEFCLQQDEDDDEEEILMEKSHINIIPKSDQSLISMNISTIDSDFLEKINNIIKRLFEIKRSNKTFFLNNEHNLQLDSLLKNDLCSAIQNILEHGRKDLKKITLWKIIQISIEQNTSSSQQFYKAKQFAQNISSNWLYKFQAFIFALLNKNELINWLYYFTRQKDLIQRYYQSPDALILVSISSTFNLFERIMTQLEKLTSLPFHLIYHPPLNDEQLNPTTNPREWVMTLSRRSTKNFTLPINSNDTFRSTLTRKLNAIFTKTKNSSVVTTKLPGSPVNRSFQSKIPRPSLNVDKPKSVRYRCTISSE